jgi:hypothetical protein
MEHTSETNSRQQNQVWAHFKGNKYSTKALFQITAALELYI